jgi:hypothetical protein
MKRTDSHDVLQVLPRGRYRLIRRRDGTSRLENLKSHVQVSVKDVDCASPCHPRGLRDNIFVGTPIQNQVTHSVTFF